MKKFIEHIKTNKTPHERRSHAAKVAGVCTALVFVGWLGTLGLRFSSGNAAVATNGSKTQESRLANVINGVGQDDSQNSLEVSTSSYNGQ